MRIERGIASGDVHALARLHQVAFPGFFLSGLGHEFLRQFYLGFVDDPTAVVVVCRDGGGVLGGVVVGTTEPAGFFARLLRRRFWGFAIAAARTSIRNPAMVPRLSRALVYRGDAPPGGGALLSSICVDPNLRGHGVGAMLIRDWRQFAAERGARSAYLTTDAHGNDSINAFYRADGWQLTGTFVTREGRRMNRFAVGLTDVGAAGHS